MLPVVEDRIFILGEVKTPGAHDFRPDLTPREYVALAGGPANRASLMNTLVYFRHGKKLGNADWAPSATGAVGVGLVVTVLWWPVNIMSMRTSAEMYSV